MGFSNQDVPLEIILILVVLMLIILLVCVCYHCSERKHGQPSKTL